MISPPPTAPKALVLTEDQYRVFRQDFLIDKVKKLSTELQNTLESESTESDHGTYQGSQTMQWQKPKQNHILYPLC